MRRASTVDLLTILLLLAVAAFFRFYRLDQIPIGLWRDEAANGVEALRVLEGHHALFFGTREPMFIYLVALSVAVLGRNAVAIRVVAAIAGTATIPVSYLLFKEQFRSGQVGGRLVAFLATLWLATSYWHINFSRLGFRGILLPLVSALSFYLLWRGWNLLTAVGERRPSKPFLTLVYFAGAGACLGLTQYTYTPSRFLPLALLPMVCLAMANRVCQRKAHPQSDRGRLGHPSPLLGLVVLGLSCLIVFAPLGTHFWTEPASFFARSRISVLGAEMEKPVLFVVAQNAVRQLSMFGFAADPNTRHDPAGRPAFDIVTVVFFVVGVAITLRRWRQIPYLFNLAWFCVMLLPAILTVSELPHFLRVIGALPVAYALPAMGAERAWHWLTVKPGSGRIRLIFAVLLALYFALMGFFTLRDYFCADMEEIELVKAFDPRFVEVAFLMNRLDEPDAVWIIPLGPNGEQRMAYFVIDFLHQGQAPHRYVRVAEKTVAQELSQACAHKKRAMMLNRTEDPLSQPWFDVYADSAGLIPLLLDRHACLLETLHFDGLDVLVYQLPGNVSFSVPEELDSLHTPCGEGLSSTGIVCQSLFASASHAPLPCGEERGKCLPETTRFKPDPSAKAGTGVESTEKPLLSDQGQPTSDRVLVQEGGPQHSLPGLPRHALGGTIV